jgi:hypothetical protein
MNSTDYEQKIKELNTKVDDIAAAFAKLTARPAVKKA